MWTSLAKLLFNLTVIYVICNPVEIHLTQQDETTTVLRDNQIHPKIGYVLPNSQYSQNASSRISSPLVKLAWVIHGVNPKSETKD